MDIFHVLLGNGEITEISKILHIITGITGNGVGAIAYLERNVAVKAAGGHSPKDRVVEISVENLCDFFTFRPGQGHGDILVRIDKGQGNIGILVDTCCAAGRQHQKEKGKKQNRA
jgi:hypothetical protein